MRRDQDERAQGQDRDRTERGEPLAERQESLDDAPPPVATAPKAEGMGGGAGELKRNSMESRSIVPSPTAQDAAPGTGWGDRRYDPVNQVEFVAERNPVDRITLRYEYASGLRALGIDLRRDRVWEREHGELGFAKSPQW